MRLILFYWSDIIVRKIQTEYQEKNKRGWNYLRKKAVKHYFLAQYVQYLKMYSCTECTTRLITHSYTSV